MTIPTKPEVTPPAPAEPPAPPSTVDKHLNPPEPTSPEFIAKMQQDALDREKASNATLHQALAAQQQTNEQLVSMMERQQETQQALQDLVQAQIPAAPETPAAPAAPQPGQVTDMTQTLAAMEQRIAANVNKTLEPFAARLAMVSNDNDRRTFEIRLSDQVGQPMRLTAVQDEEIKRQMGLHPTMQYADAANFLQGDLAIVAPSPSQTPTPQAAPQPQTPGAPVQPDPRVPTPRPATPAPPPATPPGPPGDREPKGDHEPGELIQAARNAENAGNKGDQESILFDRIRQGTVDPHGQFRDFFQGKKVKEAVR